MSEQEAKPQDPTTLTLTPFGDAIAGAAGAFVANALVYPIDVIKTRLQVQSKSVTDFGGKSYQYQNIWHGVYSIFMEEGLGGLYAGVTSGLFGTVFSNFTYFYWYSLFREIFGKRFGSSDGTSRSTAFELALGAAAGAVSQVFVLPISVITTRQQTAQEGERESFLKTARSIVENEGILGLWSGFRPSMVLCSNPSITYGAFEKGKALLMQLKLSRKSATEQRDLRLHSVEIFLLGAIAKTLATIVTYPYIMAKVRLQWKAPLHIQQKLSQVDKERLSYKHSWDVLAKVYREAGISGWYKGMKVQIVKAVLCQAILFVTKAKFTWWTILLYRLLKKQRHLLL